MLNVASHAIVKDVFGVSLFHKFYLTISIQRKRRKKPVWNMVSESFHKLGIQGYARVKHNM